MDEASRRPSPNTATHLIDAEASSLWSCSSLRFVLSASDRCRSMEAMVLAPASNDNSHLDYTIGIHINKRGIKQIDQIKINDFASV